MKNKVYFGQWEATCLLTMLINTQIFLNFPRFMAESAGTAGWILALFVSVVVLIGFIVISKLYEPFKGKDLLEVAEKAFGGAGRVVVGILVTAYLVFIISVVLREFSEDMKTISLNESPISFVTLFFLSGMILGSYFGIEGIVRLGAIAVPVISIGYYFIIAAVSWHFDFDNIFPLMGNGPSEIFIKGLAKVSIFSALHLLFFIAPFLKNEKCFKKVGFLTIILTGINFVAGSFVYLVVFPYPTALENFLPIYQLAKLINYGRFFQRVESVFVFIWGTAALIYLSAGFFFIVHIFKITFRLKYYKPLIIPFAILVFNISLLPSSLMQSIELENDYFRNYIWIVTFLLPLIVLIFARARQRKVN